jgi:multidrug efflux system outer membrane protein
MTDREELIMKFSVQPLVKPLAAPCAAAGRPGAGRLCHRALGPARDHDRRRSSRQSSRRRRWTSRAAPAEAQAAAPGGWPFNDPVLNALVERPTSTTPASRPRRAAGQARALARSANADRLPQIGLGAGANRGAGWTRPRPAAPRRRTLTNAGATFSYEVDLFGRLSGASDAAGSMRRPRGAAAEHAPAGAGRGGADLPGLARARRRARAGARDRSRPTATRCA